MHSLVLKANFSYALGPWPRRFIGFVREYNWQSQIVLSSYALAPPACRQAGALAFLKATFEAAQRRPPAYRQAGAFSSFPFERTPLRVSTETAKSFPGKTFDPDHSKPLRGRFFLQVGIFYPGIGSGRGVTFGL